MMLVRPVPVQLDALCHNGLRRWTDWTGMFATFLL